MSKIHLFENEKIRCQPSRAPLSVNWTIHLDSVTCLHCRKALGLSVTTLKMSSRHARLTLRLPNGRAAHEVLLESFHLKVVEAEPTGQDRDSYINFEPPPMQLEVRLTESGYAAIRGLFLRLPAVDRES